MPPALTAAQRSMPFPVRIADVSGFESCPTAPEIAAATSTYQMGKNRNTLRQKAHCPLSGRIGLARTLLWASSARSSTPRRREEVMAALARRRGRISFLEWWGRRRGATSRDAEEHDMVGIAQWFPRKGTEINKYPRFVVRQLRSPLSATVGRLHPHHMLELLWYLTHHVG